jgi:hypothetical protein
MLSAPGLFVAALVPVRDRVIPILPLEVEGTTPPLPLSGIVGGGGKLARDIHRVRGAINYAKCNMWRALRLNPMITHGHTCYTE